MSSSTTSPNSQKKNVVSQSLPKPKHGVIETSTGFFRLEEEDNGDNEEEDMVTEDLERPKNPKQRRMAERRRDPILAKHEIRKANVNLNSFKQKYLTLKKKVSALQLEVGGEEDFPLIVKNNLQTPSRNQQSLTAGKYMIYGKGSLSDQFHTTGIKFASEKMVKMENNYDYTLDNSVNPTNDEGKGRDEHCRKKRKQNTLVHAQACKIRKQSNNQIPKKVSTPGTFLGNLSVHSSSSSEADNDNESDTGEGHDLKKSD